MVSMNWKALLQTLTLLTMTTSFGKHSNQSLPTETQWGRQSRGKSLLKIGYVIFVIIESHYFFAVIFL